MGLGVRELFDNNIKVHFAGSDGGEIFYAALLAAQTKYRLFSCYKYILKCRPDDDFRLPADHVIRVQDTVNRHVIQDSGLFTLMFGAGKGQTQTLESLTEWQDKLIAFVQQNNLRCTCVELDCQKVLGVREAWYFRERMKKLLDNPQINVFHFEDGMRGLDSMIDFSDYIALSIPELRIIKPKTFREDTRYLTHYIKNRKPEIDIHLLGFGNLRLSAKCLEAIVPQTRELLMSTKYSADELFAADLSRRMQLGLDWGALYGTGGEFQPTGIANTPGVEKIDAKKMDAQYAADGKLTADFPVYVKSLVMSKNVDDQALGWAFNSFMEGYLKNIKTTTGDYIYRDEMNAGNFLGMPYKVSNQIPTDSKTGCTEMFFGNWADLMIGDQMGLETYTTLDGTWTDENGVQHNAFEENLTGTRALMYDDIGVRHVESFAYVHNIKVI